MAPTSPSAHAEMQAWLQQRRTELRDEIAQASATVREIDVSDGSEVSDQKDESVRRSLSDWVERAFRLWWMLDAQRSQHIAQSSRSLMCRWL